MHTSTILHRDLSEIADRLLEHLDFIRMDPKRILNYGLHTTYTAERLRARYPTAEIHSLSVSQKMPNQNNDYDFIFSNFLLPWSTDIGQTLAEFKRILISRGLLLFTTVGPDTLKELRDSFAAVDNRLHVPTLVDMHDIGDALMQLFENPVMDMEHITVNYATLDQLFQDLKIINAKKALIHTSKGLMGKNAWKEMIAHYQTVRNDQGKFPATIELIYGHAWGSVEGEIIIAAENIIRSKPTASL